MKSTKLTYLLAIVMAMSFAATGCKKKPTTPLTVLPDGRIGQRTDPDPRTLPGGDPVKPDAPVDSTGGHPLPTDINPDAMNNERAALAAHTVHFDYDSIAIRSGERANVEAVASFMKGAAPNVALLVEGHCDERGTEEYNRALGERRALALRDALISSGADANRIVTRSYGKDRKISTGNDAASHAKNRRGEFVVLTPK